MKSPITLLAGILLILGGLALGGSAAFQLAKPSLFEGATKIRVVPAGSSGTASALFIKTEAERIQSPEVLTNVIADLNLNDLWGKKYNQGQRVSDLDAQRLLRVNCRPIRNSDLIEIKVSSEDPTEPAALANAIVRNYRVHYVKVASVTVVMPATAPTRAVSPNRPLLMVCIAAGVFMVIGGIVCLADSAGKSED